MPRGRKKNYHNRGRHFTNPDELRAAEEKEKREKEWRKQHGIPSDDEEEAGGAAEEQEDRGARSSGASKSAPSHGAPGELPPSSSEEETDSEDERDRHKGIEHLIEIENPNRVKQKTKKVTALDTEEGPTLSRKEKEELEKQQAKERYMKAHLAGKTEEARADLARLALIRKQREDAARKKAEEKQALDAKKKAAEDKLLDKKKTDKSK